MTVIAWDGKTLAADKLASYGGMNSVVTKIQRIGNVLVGGSGDTCFISQMFEWVRSGRIASDFPSDQRNKDDWQTILVIEKDGSTSIYERTPFPIRFEQRFIAIGSGREYARAAMHLGLDALKAVEVAIALDTGCGNGIDTLRLGE